MTSQWYRCSDGTLAGVCKGLAERFDVDVVLVRLALIFSTLFFGFGLGLYIILAISLPRKDKLDRALEAKILGVCSRFAQRFDLDVGLTRATFCLLFLASGGSVLFVYIILYFILPKSSTGLIAVLALLSLSYATLAITGCATVSDEVSLKKISPQQRFYVGRLKINFNGDEKPKCEVYLNYDIAPSIKLNPDGFIFYKTDREHLQIKSLACFHKGSTYLSAWHHHDLNLTKIHRPIHKDDIVYFGDIMVDWKFDKQSTLDAAQKGAGTGSPFREGQVYNSGELQTTIENHVEGLDQIIYSRWPELNEKGYKLSVELVKPAE